MGDLIFQSIQSIFYDRILPNGAAGAVFISLILIFRQITKRWSKGYVRILWVLLLAVLLAPPLFHGSFYTIRNLSVGSLAENVSIRNRTSQNQSEDSAQMESLPVESHEPQQENNLQYMRIRQTRSLPESLTDTGLSDTQGIDRVAQIKMWGALLWIVGAIAMLLFYLCQYLMLHKKMADAVFVPGHGYWISGRTDVPFVMPGFLPRIYLPMNITEVQKENILAHERQHIKNFDPMFKCLSAAVLAIYWFHPLVWLAVSLMGKDMEMYCDECVMRGKGIEERKAYSSTLLEYAVQSSGLSVTMRFGESNTGNRIRHILHMKKPRLAVSMLLALFIGASGMLFLTSRRVEAENQAQETEASKQASVQQKDFRQDPYKFAKKVIRLVKKEKKEGLSKLIQFPIRTYMVDGEEIYLHNAGDFVNNYDKIVNEEWKKGIIDTDVDHMINNYMGYGMGFGGIWFSQVIGQEGYWIYAINNADVPQYYVDYDESIKGNWERLAGEQGMTGQEAQKWYVRFEQDALDIVKNHIRITGCIYEDVDQNGIKDLFVVASLDPHESYPEDMVFTTYVYGYINGELSYSHGIEDFSQDGFSLFEVNPATENGISCNIRYIVDTDQLKEKQHLLKFDMQGRFVGEQFPEESQKTIQMLSEVPEEAYTKAVSFEKFQYHIIQDFKEEKVPDVQMVSLYENTAEDITIYGYVEKNLNVAGTVIYYKGTYSFFDMDIFGEYPYMAPMVVQEDIDGDSEAEFVCIYSAGHGTGVFTGGLTVFDVQRDHTVLGYELKEYDMLWQVGQFIRFDREHGKVDIGKDGNVKKEIDLTVSSEYEANADTVEINYSNVYSYDVVDGRVKLQVNVLGEIGFLWYMEGIEDSWTEFDVLFEDGKFRIDI